MKFETWEGRISGIGDRILPFLQAWYNQQGIELFLEYSKIESNNNDFELHQDKYLIFSQKFAKLAQAKSVKVSEFQGQSLGQLAMAPSHEMAIEIADKIPITAGDLDSGSSNSNILDRRKLGLLGISAIINKIYKFRKEGFDIKNYKDLVLSLLWNFTHPEHFKLGVTHGDLDSQD